MSQKTALSIWDDALPAEVWRLVHAHNREVLWRYLRLAAILFCGAFIRPDEFDPATAPDPFAPVFQFSLVVVMGFLLYETFGPRVPSFDRDRRTAARVPPAGDLPGHLRALRWTPARADGTLQPRRFARLREITHIIPPGEA